MMMRPVTSMAQSMNNNNNNNASISIAQNKLSSVALTEVGTNMSLVSGQKSAKKQTQSEGLLVNCCTECVSALSAGVNDRGAVANDVLY